jgi:hypothetical protein
MGDKADSEAKLARADKMLHWQEWSIIFQILLFHLIKFIFKGV